MAKLILPSQQTSYSLKKIITTIGSDKKSDLHLSHPSVSPFHCLLTQQNDQFFLTATQGEVLVNGGKIKKQLLHHHDRIKIGKVELIFSLLEEGNLGEQLQIFQKFLPPAQKKELQEVKKQITALENKLFFLEEQNKKNQILQQISFLLSSPLKTEDLLNRIMDLALKTFRAERGFLMMVDEEGSLIPRAARIMEEEKIKTQQDLTISYSTLEKVKKTKKPIIISNISQNPVVAQQKSIIQSEIKSILCTPLLQENQEIIGLLYLDTRIAEGVFREGDLELIKGFSGYVGVVLERELWVEREKKQLAKIIRLEEEARYVRQIKKMEEERETLQKRIETYQFEEIIGASAGMQEVFKLIRQIAPTEATVLIVGETGTGKELVARAIYEHSPRNSAPFITINCGSIPETLLESELFGYRRGSFTGAAQDKPGKIEAAEGGVLFLDEIGELPLSLQAKFLRVLENKEIEKIGEEKSKKVNIRILAATNKNLEEEVKKGNFRKDLWYRLNIISIKIPPLRARGEDVLLLSHFFLNKFSREMQKKIKGISLEAENFLLRQRWPGNVRELQNKIYRAVLLAEGDYITLKELGEEEKEMMSLKEQKANFERELVLSVWRRNGGNLTKTAQQLQISRRGLAKIITKYNLKN
jgi:transcriptional regulator with GAF, ATPase, and Fis domain